MSSGEGDTKKHSARNNKCLDTTRPNPPALGKEPQRAVPHKGGARKHSPRTPIEQEPQSFSPPRPSRYSVSFNEEAFDETYMFCDDVHTRREKSRESRQSENDRGRWKSTHSKRSPSPRWRPGRARGSRRRRAGGAWRRTCWVGDHGCSRREISRKRGCGVEMVESPR